MFLDATRTTLISHSRKSRCRRHRIRLNDARRLLFEPLEDRRMLVADFDYGDAPDPSFPTLLVSNGARHTIEAGFHLGATIDEELDGQPHEFSLGDDTDGNNDDDGVSFVGRPEFPGQSGNITVTLTDATGGGGSLDAWVDFNNNSIWESSEQIAASTPLVAGPNQIPLTNPGDAVTGYVHARFRLSREGGLVPDGSWSNGEVEDYVLLIKAEPMDFGDAPLPYPTFSGYVGAMHTTVPDFHLGAEVDSEFDGQPNFDATGDDVSGTAPDDEDGVSFGTPLLTGQSANLSVTVTDTGPLSGFLDAWIDWNQDSDWDDAGEKVFDRVGVSDGVNNLNINTPINAETGITFARFRLSSAGGLAPRGYAEDGEVEDHQVEILAANVVQIIDNGDTGYSTVGTWATIPDPGAFFGHETDIDYSEKGNGSDVARWTFNVTPGMYKVSATWSAHANRGQDAPYTILDNGSALGTVNVNQEQAPNDFTDAGSPWEDLGTFTITGSTLNVELSDAISDAGTQYVIADAVRIEKIGPVTPAPEIELLDGSTNIADGGTLNFGTTPPNTAIDKEVTVRNTGTQDLTLTSLGGVILPNGFSLVSDFGTLTLPPGQLYDPRQRQCVGYGDLCKSSGNWRHKIRPGYILGRRGRSSTLKKPTRQKVSSTLFQTLLDQHLPKTLSPVR